MAHSIKSKSSTEILERKTISAKYLLSAIPGKREVLDVTDIPITKIKCANRYRIVNKSKGDTTGIYSPRRDSVCMGGVYYDTKARRAFGGGR